MFENGTFAVLGPDGKQVQCDVLFTYDCEDNGRSYVVFTTGEGAQQRLFANRYDTRAAGRDLRARGAHRSSAGRERQDRLFQTVPARRGLTAPIGGTTHAHSQGREPDVRASDL